MCLFFLPLGEPGKCWERVARYGIVCSQYTICLAGFLHKLLFSDSIHDTFIAMKTPGKENTESGERGL